jgi:hypothetical protein
MTDADLITHFVASFEKLDDLLSVDPIPPELAIGGDELPGGRMWRWRPLQIATERSVLDELLFPLGLIPFGYASDNYDPLCFDTRRRDGDGNCPVIRVEHEAVLRDLRLGESWEVAESFRSLMYAAIAAAA